MSQGVERMSETDIIGYHLEEIEKCKNDANDAFVELDIAWNGKIKVCKHCWIKCIDSRVEIINARIL